MIPPKEWPTPHPCVHHAPRPRPIGCIVLHDTGAHTASSTLNWFARPESKVSAHVVIDRDGRIYRVVPDERAAWHAGKSVLHGVENLNAWSLGVEMVDANDDGSADPYPDAQVEACAQWVATKCKQYRIPLNMVVGHDQVCVPRGRKVDPNKDWPMRAFLIRVATLQT